ncbi:MAG: PAS domain S-box protein [Nodosilinea sp.]
MSDLSPPAPYTVPVPANEPERLAALHRYKILDTPSEVAFDRITELAARLFGVPIALISLVDESRAWFKSCVGFGAREVPRDATLCSFAVLTDEPLIVADTRQDDRFACNPFVQAEPGVRFYAGAPLISCDGFNLGTLCLLDNQPRCPLTPDQQATLVDLAAMVVDELELRLAARQIAQINDALRSITYGVATVTGQDFLNALVQHFAQVLGVDYVYIGLIESSDDLSTLRTIATYAHGQIVENLEYRLQNTPCCEVLRQRQICCYPRQVQAHFPHAPLFQQLGVESYMAIPFFDSSGTPLGLLGVMDGKPLNQVQLVESLLTVFADRISTELERQQIAREQERFFAVASDLQVITRTDGYFQWVSPTFERLLGWTVEEMITRPWTDFVHPDDITPSMSEAESLFSGCTTLEFENRYRHKDGSYRWLLWNAHPYPDEQLIYGVAVDITDRKLAEAQLQEQATLLQLIIDSIDDGLVLASPKGDFLLVNQAAERIFGPVTNERPCGEWAQTYGLYLPDQETLFPERQLPLYRAMQGEMTTDVELFVRRVPADPGRWISVSGCPVRDQNGEITGGVVSCRDVTERKHMLQQEQAAREEAERANRVKDEFLAVLSHELRSPLNPILGWTRLLQTGKLDANRQREALGTIERNANLQTQLIDDLLDIARIMQGKLSLTVAPVSLPYVITAAVETVRLAAEAKNIQIVLDLTPQMAPVSGDVARLQQVVWNLLSNAVKFTPSGGQVMIELRPLEQSAQMRVVDTGKGIAPQFLPYVFDYFRQADASTTRTFGGLGLGLAIVRQIVEMHGGTVAAESGGEGQGATFIVQLPLSQQARLNEFDPPCPSPTAAAALSDLQILLVDDEPDTREFQVVLLQQHGAIVTAVASGSEALQALDRFVPDMLVSDIGMADMDGYMLIQKIRSRPHDRGGLIPAIALTAYARDFDQQKALQSGFQAHITKPVEPEALVNEIIKLVACR